jgi:hypothetical protein
MERSFHFPRHGFSANAALLRAWAGDGRQRVDRRFPLHAFADARARFAAGERVKPRGAHGG